MLMRVLDYERPSPFSETIGKPRSIAWPVAAYRVTFPYASRTDRGMNPFERAVVKLLQALGPIDEKALSHEMCVPIDLVKGILLRLIDRGVIDDRHAVRTDESGDAPILQPQDPTFISAVIFRECVSGRILPFVHHVSDSNPLRQREAERDVKAIPADRNMPQRPPEPRDVINAVRAMQRQVIHRGDIRPLPQAGQVLVMPNPERYYLECQIAIMAREGEFRIGDPFGAGLSMVMDAAFTQLLERDAHIAGWLVEWKESLSGPQAQRSKDQDEGSKQPFETDANRRRYPKLIANLRTARWQPTRSIKQIYSSIEWSLFYVCRCRPFEDAVALLGATSASEHAAMLSDAAARVGLKPPGRGFREVPKGRLIDFQCGKAEMGTVLAIAILQATKDFNHPLRAIAAKHITILDWCLSLKRKVDGSEHGNGAASVTRGELASDFTMREVVHALLPDIRFEDTPVELGVPENGDSLLSARTALQEELGFRLFNRLGISVIDRLTHAERFWQSCRDGDNALGFVCDLYAAVQAEFRATLLGKLAPEVSDAELRKSALESACRARLCTALPMSLQTVKILAIRQTLQGIDQTLGSCVIAYLMVANPDTLGAIANVHPTFIDDIDLILTRRGHGNEPLPLSKQDICRLRKAAISTIKSLREV
jgi:hypothetical protein